MPFKSRLELELYILERIEVLRQEANTFTSNTRPSNSLKTILSFILPALTHRRCTLYFWERWPLSIIYPSTLIICGCSIIKGISRSPSLAIVNYWKASVLSLTSPNYNTDELIFNLGNTDMNLIGTFMIFFAWLEWMINV